MDTVCAYCLLDLQSLSTIYEINYCINYSQFQKFCQDFREFSEEHSVINNQSLATQGLMPILGCPIVA